MNKTSYELSQTRETPNKCTAAFAKYSPKSKKIVLLKKIMTIMIFLNLKKT